MDQYISGSTIRAFRLREGMTQTQLAEKLMVSDKTVSKWETDRGLPDITLLAPLAEALQVSLTELFSGQLIANNNRGGNMLRTVLYRCPLCGNIMHAAGPVQLSCCGIALPPMEAEDFDEDHRPVIEPVEDELFVHIPHPMTKEHYITFLARVTGDRVEMVKLYPEGNAEARFRRGHGILYACCNRHGLMKCRL